MAVRRFRIRVNDVIYDVEAEEVTTEPVPEHAQSTAGSVAVVTPPSAKEPPRPPLGVETPDGESVIEAPLPGAVLDVKVQEGQLVEVGQILIILEAMKMENEVTAPISGRIKSLRVHKGSAVNANEVLVIIEHV